MVWAEARGVPSGIVALLAASLAIWIVLLDGCSPAAGGRRRSCGAGWPSGWSASGCSSGPRGRSAPAPVRWTSRGPGSCSAGRSRGRPGRCCRAAAGGRRRRSRGSALQMLSAARCCSASRARTATSPAWRAGGTPGARGRWRRCLPVVFGSLVGFTAYVWLMRNAAPSKVATYAYVNPVVAVGLGWRSRRAVRRADRASASAVIVGAVALITAGRARPAR